MDYEEKIRRIEQAPKEVQTMVAKAFLRDDIPDEEIQYLFNTMPLEEMYEEDIKIENMGAKQPEGIGATGFTIRNTTPYDNKQYITRGSGGYSNCIKGYPMDEHANVLANCVGYASGRYNELIELARDFHECRYTNLRCNACYFIERAQEAGLEIGNEPRVGAIMCWGGGPSGCGHVAIVERVDSSNKLFISASDYGGTTFYNATINNDNGRWGLSSSFYFRGFIYQQPDVQEWIRGITPNVERDKYKDQIEVKVPELRVRTSPSLNGGILGYAGIGFYNYYATKEVDGYVWYMIAENQWIASNDEWTTIYPAEKPKDEYINLPPDIEERNIYDTTTKARLERTLKPAKFGGLSYKIYSYVDDKYYAEIETLDYGRVLVRITDKTPITNTPTYEHGNH